MDDSRSDEPPGEHKGKTGSEISTIRSRGKMFQEALQQIRHFLMLLWYFLTDQSPDQTRMEEKLGHMPETQAKRLRRRWQRSRERALRQRMHKAA